MCFLGFSLFNTKGEPREAVVALSMLKYGNWILPVNNGMDIAYKPPFFHWCIAIISCLRGAVTEFTSRLPSALALTAMVIACYKFYAKKTYKLALLTCLIILTCFEVHRAGMACRVDMMLSALTVMALYQLYDWGEQDMRGFPWLAILCMSGAFLTKGPVGIILPCLVEAVFLLIRGKNFWRIVGKFVIVALASCVIPALWYVAAYYQGGDKFLQLVYEENILRFTGKMTYISHNKPVSYNFLTVISGIAPYTLLLIMSLFVLKYKRIRNITHNTAARITRYFKEMDDVRLFSLLTIIIIFVFYCIPKSKRSVYLLPIYPFLAYFLAEYLMYLSKKHIAVVKAYGNLLVALSIIFLIAFVCVRLGLVPENIISGRHAAQNMEMLKALATAPLRIMTVVIILLPIIASVYFICMKRKGGRKLLFSITAIILAIYMSLDAFYLPVMLNSKSDYSVAMRIKSVIPEGTIYSYRTDITVGDRMHPFTVNFYLGDRIVPFEYKMPSDGYLISGNNDIETFKTTYPEYAVRETIDFNHKSCDDGKMLHLYKFNRKKDRI
ncbi:MAG: glycosyltransferase family 39 protein [Prevotella sp.]|nr:glycosyltransferase family 39 protein [Prevotella sp.]